jgi:hypothetical protein
MPRIDLIQFRRGIASLWTSVNTLLSAGEPGFETDKYRLKVGNGTQPWNSLLYLAGSGVPAILAGSGISVITGVGSVGSQYYNQPNVPFYIIHNTGVISITGGSGISVSGSGGIYTINNTGVISITGGSGISISESGGIYTISNTGVISITGGNGISVSGSGGYYTVINTGVISITGGNGISVTGSDGYYTVINTGVISITGGDGISVTGSDGVYTVINTGVIGISGGNGISVTGSGGLYTVTNIGVISISPGYGIGVSYYDGMYTVTNTGVISISGGNGISVSGSSGLYTIETTGLSVIGHTHTASNITDFNNAVSGLLTNYSISGHTHTASNITDFNNAVSGLLTNYSISGHTHTASNITDFNSAVSGLLTNYSISGHTHTASSITDFNEAVDDRIGSGLFVAGTGINLNYNDAGNTFTVSVTDLIANPSGNRILTSRDSTTTGIDAESNLMFDGSLLSVSGNLVANTGTLDIIQFNTNNGPVGSQGQMGWNSTEGTVDIALTDSTIMEIGQHRFFRVRNTTGSPLYKGQVVYANGVHPNGIITPNLYIANNTINEIRFIGLIWDTINNNNNGYVIDFGHLRHLDLDGSATNYAVGDETWNDGDILYAHPTVAGKLTNVKPKHAISLAIILDNGNANGQLFVRPTNFGDLSYNHDVNISGVTNGQFLQYDSTTDYWVASSSGNFSTLQVSGINVSVSGHTHISSNITDFNSAVSGLLPTIANSGNNRILTSTGTTTGIDAESDLTFENKTLNIGSSGNAGTEAIINLYTNDGGDGEPSINFKDYDDNTKLKIYWDNDENTSYVYSLNDTLVLSGPTNYIGINNDGTIGIVSSGVTSNNNFSITNQTANTIASFDANKNVTSLDTGTYPNLTELSYVKGVTSAIQTQLNAKQNTLTNPVTGTGIASHVAYWNSSSGIVADSGQLYWDATNNRLGIGTSTPSGQLHVIGTGNFSQNLHIGAPANTGVIAGLSTTSTVPALSFQSVTANHTSASHTIFDFRKNISTRVLYIDGAGSTTIDATNGNLVVPSTTPSAGNGALIAHGMRRATTTAGMDFAWGESISSITEPGIDLFPIGGTHISSGILFRLSKNSTKSNVAMLVDGNGKVGIGTASPQQFVHISGNFACGSEILRLQNSGVYLGIGIGASGCFQNYAIFYRNENRSFGIIPGTENVIFFSGIQMAATKQIRGDNGNASITLEQTANGNLAISAASGIKFQSSSVDKMTLTSDGKLGIGTTTPSGTLHVVGTGNITTVNTIPTFLQTSALTTNTNNWNPGYGDIIRVSGSTGGINITGLTAPTGLGSQYVRIVINTGPSHNLTINHQSASSSSENRFITSTGGDHIIPPTGTVSILYDTVDSRWRIL